MALIKEATNDKTFDKICGMSQEELKSFLKDYLTENGYEVIDEAGYLFAKAKETNPIPVLLTAHLDTVHKERIKEILKTNHLNKDTGEIETYYTSEQGIGGDDRCGVYMIMNIIKEHNVSVLFCEDEEIGCVGSGRFALHKEHLAELEDIKYMIELDRRGEKDAVFYRCGNKEFIEWIEKETGYKKAFGSCSDISNLMPALDRAGVNFSCGYYNEHTKGEYVVYEQMQATQDMVCELLKKEIPQTFDYQKTKALYHFGNYYGEYYEDDYGYDYDDYDDWDGYYGNSRKKKSKTKKSFVSNTEIELVVKVRLWKEISVTGKTKPECWMNLFMEHDYLCYKDIQDYYYV